MTAVRDLPDSVQTLIQNGTELVLMRVMSDRIQPQMHYRDIFNPGPAPSDLGQTFGAFGQSESNDGTLRNHIRVTFEPRKTLTFEYTFTFEDRARQVWHDADYAGFLELK